MAYAPHARARPSCPLACVCRALVTLAEAMLWRMPFPPASGIPMTSRQLACKPYLCQLTALQGRASKLEVSNWSLAHVYEYVWPASGLEEGQEGPKLKPHHFKSWVPLFPFNACCAVWGWLLQWQCTLCRKAQRGDPPSA